jgi:transposase
MDYLDAILADLSAEVARRLAPLEETLDRLDAIPGIGRVAAENLVAEIRANMERFPSADHLTSWAGMAPGNHESAGKRKSGKTRKGSRWLRALLVNAAHAAGRTKRSALGNRYRALAARRGSKRAAVAIGRSILIIAYHLIKDGQPYEDGRLQPKPPRPGPTPAQLIAQLQTLGYEVRVQPLSPVV